MEEQGFNVKLGSFVFLICLALRDYSVTFGVQILVPRVTHVEEEEEIVEKTEKVEYTRTTLRGGLFCKCQTLLLFFFTTS